MEFPALSKPVSVNIADFTQLSHAIDRRFQAGEGFALATINLDHLEKLARDDGFAQAYQAQDFVVADGNPIVWLSHLAKRPVTLMPGSDLVVPLARLAAKAGAPVALIGSTEAALSKAAKALCVAVPDLKIASCIAPEFGFDPDSAAAAAVLDQAQADGARLCFLALGAPKQERLAARGRKQTPEMGFASIGAGLDFLAGTQTRAPKWMQILALEWLWRLLSNPTRLAMRYGKCFAILPGLTRDALRQRRRA